MITTTAITGIYFGLLVVNIFQISSSFKVLPKGNPSLSNETIAKNVVQ